MNLEGCAPGVMLMSLWHEVSLEAIAHSLACHMYPKNVNLVLKGSPLTIIRVPFDMN